MSKAARQLHYFQRHPPGHWRLCGVRAELRNGDDVSDQRMVVESLIRGRRESMAFRRRELREEREMTKPELEFHSPDETGWEPVNDQRPRILQKILSNCPETGNYTRL